MSQIYGVIFGDPMVVVESDSLSGQKRKLPAVDDGGLELRVSKKTKAKGGVVEVAEMLLVLSAMGKMRGGRSPTDVEKEMVEEARERLAEMCMKFAPKDVFPCDGFGGVIEELGLNKVKQKSIVGGDWQPPKMSITEKLMATKRKVWKVHLLFIHFLWMVVIYSFIIYSIVLYHVVLCCTELYCFSGCKCVGRFCIVFCGYIMPHINV